MRSVFLEAYAKAILGFVWVGFGFFFPSLGLFFPFRAGAVGEAGSRGIPTTRLASHPLGSGHATGWNWNRESFVACKQCQFAWNGVLLVSFFGLHGTRHAWPCAHLLLPDTRGSREEPGEAKALPQSPPEPPAQPRRAGRCCQPCAPRTGWHRGHGAGSAVAH